mgnify:CR=1 FL=1
MTTRESKDQKNLQVDPRLLVIPSAGPMTRIGLTRVYSHFQEEIRDTRNHTPKYMVPLHNAGKYGFDIVNDCDQAVTVLLYGASAGSGVGERVAAISSAFSVSANTREFFASEVWAPWVGLRVNYSTAPTSGTLGVTAVVQELV